MGLTVPVAEAILAEHRYKEIKGDVLFIGRQTSYLDETSLERLLRKYGLSLPKNFEYEFDTETRGAAGQRLITDRCFMRSLGVERINFLDVTDYEQADIVHDLGYPVPDSLLDRYDFIYNGGCLDNMFNPGVAITNLSKMLRSGGRVICFESASSINSPYLMYSPGWFWDYYVVNSFADCKIYVGSFYSGDDLCFGPWDWYYVNLVGEHNTWQETNGPPPVARELNHNVIVSVAEKGAASTSDRQPIQLQYRVDDTLIKEHKDNIAAMRACPRPIGLGSGPTGSVEQYVTSLGKIGVGIHSRSFFQRLKKLVHRELRAIKLIIRIVLKRAVV
jgi:hypothetical protein